MSIATTTEHCCSSHRHPTRRGLMGLALAAALPRMALAQGGKSADPTTPMTLRFRGAEFVHRWSKGGQHEFTPPTQADLKSWTDMVTLNVHATTTHGEQLAVVANSVLANYQRHGKILQTRSTPRTATQPAEHLIVAVLGTPELLEATFARCLLSGGSGLVAVYSHRVYGKAVGPAMGQWLAANGQQVEQALMGWMQMPAVAGLARLPTSA